MSAETRHRRFHGAGIPLVAAAIIVGLMFPVSAQASESYPSWSDVQSARTSEQRTQAQIVTIQQTLESLAGQTERARRTAEARGRDYEDATGRLDVATGQSLTLQADAAEASDRASVARRRAAAFAAQLVRSGDRSGSLEIFLAGDDAKSILGSLGFESRLLEKQKGVFNRAAQALNRAEAANKQARSAEKALTELVAKAQESLAAATEAQRQSAAALAEQKANELRLRAQLITLRDSRISVEQGFALGEDNRRAAEAAARTAAVAQAAEASQVSPTAPSVSGWTRPIRSWGSFEAYGMRLHPVDKVWRLHAGDDFGAPCGTPLYAAAAGRVVFAGASGGYGNLVVIDHGGGISTAYGHMERGGIAVGQGQSVGAGQRIAAVGNAGVSTGCHLHFEVRRDGVAIPPGPFLSSRGVG